MESTDNTDRHRFYATLKHYDSILSFWDTRNHTFDLERAEEALKWLSHGEAIMLRFFVAVWLRENRFNFDVFEAVGTVDAFSSKMIRDWIESPYYP